METLRSSRKLYGAFSFPFKWAHWLGLDNMGMVILWFMLPTFIAALVFLPFLHPVPQTITFFFSVTMSLFSLLSSCILVVLLLPASFLGGRSDLRPLLNDNQKKKVVWKYAPTPQQSWAIIKQPEASFGKLSHQFRAFESFLPVQGCKEGGNIFALWNAKSQTRMVGHISVTTPQTQCLQQEHHWVWGSLGQDFSPVCCLALFRAYLSAVHSTSLFCFSGCCCRNIDFNCWCLENLKLSCSSICSH